MLLLTLIPGKQLHIRGHLSGPPPVQIHRRLIKAKLDYHWMSTTAVEHPRLPHQPSRSNTSFTILALLYRLISSKMPGYEFFKTTERVGSPMPAAAPVTLPERAAAPAALNGQSNDQSNGATINGFDAGPAPATMEPEAYYNARLDPKNFLEGELSVYPATRLRQMLARPGIVVAPGICDGISARAAIEAGFSCLYQRFARSAGIPGSSQLTILVFAVARQLRPRAWACPTSPLRR